MPKYLLITMILVLSFGCGYFSPYSKQTRKFIKETQFIDQQESFIEARKDRKMFFVYLNLRKHQMFTIEFGLSHYGCGVYRLSNDSVYFDYFDKSDEFVRYDYGFINKKDSTVSLFKHNDTLHLRLTKF